MSKKKTYKPKRKDLQKLKIALSRFENSREFEDLPEEIKEALK